MFDLLESRIINGIAGDVAHLRDGSKKEIDTIEKLVEVEYCPNKPQTDYKNYLNVQVWKKMSAEKISEESVNNTQEVRFERIINAKQCMEHIEMWIKFDGKETHPDSRHEDSAGSDYQTSAFIRALIGERVYTELNKIYTLVKKNNGKIKRITKKAKQVDLRITYVHEIFLTAAKLPVLVTAIEVTSKYY